MGAAQVASGSGGVPGVSFDQPLRDARDAFEKAYRSTSWRSTPATSARWRKRPVWSAPPVPQAA